MIGVGLWRIGFGFERSLGGGFDRVVNVCGVVV